MDIGYSYDYGYGWLGWVGYEVGKVNRVMCCCSHHLASLGPPYLRPPAPTPILLTTVMRMMRTMRMKMRMMVGQLPIMLFFPKALQWRHLLRMETAQATMYVMLSPVDA